MRRFTQVSVLALLCLTFPVAAAAESPDPAEAVPAETPAYVEVGPEAVEGLLPVAALPPVSGLFMPGLQGPFSYLDGMLRQPPGRMQQAVEHLHGAALAFDGQMPVGILTFDETRWPSEVLSGRERGPEGVATLLPRELFALEREEHLLIGTADSVRRFAAGDFAPLAGVAGFLQARNEAEGASAVGYLNVPELMKTARAEMSAWDRRELDSVSRLFGLDGVQHATGAVYRDGAGRLEVRVKLAEQKTGLLGLVPQAELSIAEAIPADPSAVLAFNWGDATAFFGGLRDHVVEVSRSQGEPVEQQIAATEQEWGIKFDELFAQLGTGVAVYLPRPADGRLLDRSDWTAVIDAGDPAALEGSLRRILRATTGSAPVEQTHGDRSVFQVLMPPSYYAVTDRTIVVGGSAEAVGRYLDWQERTDRESLSGALEETARTGLLRLDLGLLMNSYPVAESSIKWVTTLGRTRDVLTASVRCEDYSAEALSKLYMQAYPAVMGAMLMPALTRARAEARRARSQYNLHNIGLGLTMYAGAHNGRYPPDLETLIEEEYLDDPSMFVVETDRNPEVRGDMGLPYSYEYVGPIPDDFPAGVIVCYSREGLFPGGRNVLHHDGAVQWITEGQLQSPMGNTRESLAASYDAVMGSIGEGLSEEQKARLREFYEVEGGPRPPVWQ